MCSSDLLARRLAAHPSVARVHYPGLPGDSQHERAARVLPGGAGPMLSFEVAGSVERTEAFLAGLRLITHATSLGGVESIIPNDTLITSTVVNHSYTDKRVRQAVVVQVHYASDLDLALRTLEEIAQRQDRVLPDPAPKAFVVGLEASGIALELGFWVDDPEKGIKALRSALYASIWREFKHLGVEIPYPQQVVHLEPQNTPPPMQNTAMESKA